MSGFRFVCLGSGSGGNAILVEAGDTRVLVDGGFPVGELERRLRQVGIDPAALDGILITHEHCDHVRGAPGLARRHRVPLWMTPGTWAALGPAQGLELRLVQSHGPGFTIGALRVEPVPIPHDAREPCQYLFQAQGLRLGLCTDTGTVTPYMRERLRGCDALVLECNHDSRMLATGPYPPPLRRRVGGAFGHLSNDQAAGLLGELHLPRLRQLVAAHLSEKNNRPELVRAALLEVDPGLDGRLSLATQDGPGDWLLL